MRDYRGKRKDNGEWVYGYLIGNDVIVGDIVEFTDEYFNTEFWCKVDPETVGQYTGQKDQMKEQIYDGDILRDDEDCLNLVVWSDYGRWMVCAIMADGSEGYAAPLAEYSEGWLMVGNRFDNPDLLGEVRE